MRYIRCVQLRCETHWLSVCASSPKVEQGALLAVALRPTATLYLMLLLLCLWSAQRCGKSPATHLGW